MKKIILLFIVTFLLFLNISYANNNTIYGKINLIYEKSPEKLDIVNKKIKALLLKNYNKKTKDTLVGIKNYIDYKLKNDDYYNQKISAKTKILVSNIYNKSFTDQEKLEKLTDLYSNNNLSLIDKEYINYYILESKVGILLNHQNFDGAEKITKEYFKLNDGYDDNKLYFIVKNASYSSFGLLTQLVSWINPNKKSEIINLRSKYFPKESNSAWNIVRKNGYKQDDCEKLDIIDENRDLIDKKFCKLLSGKFEPSDIKEVDNLNNNLQNLSDKINYYGYIGMYYPDYEEEMKAKNKILGETIIEKDKNFINGYLGLLDYYDYKNDCINFDKYSSLMFQNYVGDETRKNNLIERKNNNCSIK
ncbi:hypothetical protein HUU51_05625 [Candidatus Gracilibacteria bacterium]|nr:hypothetical protein [Candidatus Gracilibacteria bacterium]